MNPKFFNKLLHWAEGEASLPVQPEHLIEADNVIVSYPKGATRQVIINNVGLRVREKEFVTVVGSSGCGKSTLLSLILGSQAPTAGTVKVDGKLVERVGRDRGIVYQNYSLYKHLTVLENIALGLMLEETSMLGKLLVSPLLVTETLLNSLLVPAGRKLYGKLRKQALVNAPAELEAFSLGPVLRWLPYFRVREEALEVARQFLLDIGLTAKDGSKYPFELSGGMQQRVAIAQSVAMRPRILLMDEPFGALDSSRRNDMQDFIHEQWKKHGLTIFFVTHDLEEAVKLGTRLICLSQYWSGPQGEAAVGAKIVVDRHVLGGEIKPSTFARDPEFFAYVDEVKELGLSKKILPWDRFDLSHEDAIKQPFV
jgi:NitT/TauT family transport system ATP-binding protein